MSKKPEDVPWVIVRAARPWLMQAALPPEAGEVLGFPSRGDLVKLSRPHRIIFFASRGPGIARVASQAESSQLYARELRAGRLLATAVVTTGNHFYIPVEVQAHLEIKTYPSNQSPKMLETDDFLLWALPVEDYTASRTGALEPKAPRPPQKEPEGHCYLVESTRVLRVLTLSPEELEIEEMGAPLPTARSRR